MSKGLPSERRLPGGLNAPGQQVPSAEPQSNNGDLLPIGRSTPVAPAPEAHFQRQTEVRTCFVRANGELRPNFENVACGPRA